MGAPDRSIMYVAFVMSIFAAILGAVAVGLAYHANYTPLSALEFMDGTQLRSVSGGVHVSTSNGDDGSAVLTDKGLIVDSIVFANGIELRGPASSSTLDVIDNNTIVARFSADGLQTSTVTEAADRITFNNGLTISAVAPTATTGAALRIAGNVQLGGDVHIEDTLVFSTAQTQMTQTSGTLSVGAMPSTDGTPEFVLNANVTGNAGVQFPSTNVTMQGIQGSGSNPLLILSAATVKESLQMDSSLQFSTAGTTIEQIENQLQVRPSTTGTAVQTVFLTDITGDGEVSFPNATVSMSGVQGVGGAALQVLGDVAMKETVTLEGDMEFATANTTFSQIVDQLQVKSTTGADVQTVFMTDISGFNEVSFPNTTVLMGGIQGANSAALQVAGDIDFTTAGTTLGQISNQLQVRPTTTGAAVQTVFLTDITGDGEVSFPNATVSMSGIEGVNSTALQVVGNVTMKDPVVFDDTVTFNNDMNFTTAGTTFTQSSNQLQVQPTTTGASVDTVFKTDITGDSGAAFPNANVSMYGIQGINGATLQVLSDVAVSKGITISKGITAQESIVTQASLVAGVGLYVNGASDGSAMYVGGDVYVYGDLGTSDGHSLYSGNQVFASSDGAAFVQSTSVPSSMASTTTSALSSLLSS